ncbi:MAG: hypothetical protein MZU97_13565 [Bacillus subtilis]|nr:hypothetical protein [Bacillus subtilis]
MKSGGGPRVGDGLRLGRRDRRHQHLSGVAEGDAEGAGETRRQAGTRAFRARCRFPVAESSFTAIIHGDALSASIGAASIVAKVERDAYMDAMDLLHPAIRIQAEQGLSDARAPRSASARLGVSPIHRKTYEPVRAVLTRGSARIVKNLP